MFLEQFLHLATEGNVTAAGTQKIGRARFRRGELQSFQEDFALRH